MFYLRYYGNGWQDVLCPITGLIATFNSVEDSKEYAESLSENFVYSVWDDNRMVESQNFNGDWLKTVDINAGV